MGAEPRDDGLAEVRSIRPRAADAGAAADAGLVDVARAVLDGMDELVPQMGAAYRREVAEYAAMDDEEFGRVLTTSDAFVRRFVAALADGVAQPLPDHEVLVGSGRRRQQAGVSLDAAMHAFRIASRVGWTGLADASTAIAPTLVSDLAGRWLEYSDRASTAFAEGHTSASSEQLRRIDARRDALVRDLLAAEDEAAAHSVAAGHGLRLTERYLPVLVAVDGDATADQVGDALPDGTVLGRRGGYLLALVPLTSDRVPTHHLHAVTRSGVVAHGAGARLGERLRGEVAVAESVLTVAVALGRDGVFGPGDLALHRAVSEHAGLERELRSTVLAPLLAADGDGIFRETLRAYLDDGAVRAVADHLFVHANTVTYRLRRVRECTGLDPRVPAQAAQLVLALALEDLDGSPHDGGRPLPDEEVGP